MSDASAAPGIAIAVVGLAARLPSAPSMAEFRELIRSGRPAIRRFGAEELRKAGIAAAKLDDPRFVPVKGAIEEADCFDFAAFRMTPMLARAMDPQHRLFLECCWHALEDAGLPCEAAGRRIGVFAGASSASSYYHSYAANDPETVQALDPFQLHIINQPAALSNLVSFHLDLTGPSVSVQTACSTGLATIVSACQSLLDVQCDAAIAGAVTVALPLMDGYLAPAGSILSPSGICRPFDACADGTVPGEGVAAIVLKRLADALQDGDRIHAVILGYGVTNDGARKVGFSAPSADGQAAAIAGALAMAEIEPRDIGFIETHGTGTILGDAIEISALNDVFSGSALQSIALGAVKAQIGHLDVAAGLAGFIKAVVSVEEGIIPPISGAQRANPELRLDLSPFRLPLRPETWPASSAPRRAGVSSFGMGGTNVHVVIEQARPDRGATDATRIAGWSVLPLSAPSGKGLERMTAGLASFLAAHPTCALADAGTTLARRRRSFDHRTAIVAARHDDAIKHLRQATPGRTSGNGRIGFVFTGQGIQPVGFARDLHAASPSFARALDACRADLAELGCTVDPYLFGPDCAELRDRLGDTEIAQPTLFAFAYAYAAMLDAWGLSPSAMIGHSLGEYVALCVSGAISRADALALVVARGRAMQKLGDGAMLAVAASLSTVRRHLFGDADIAAANGPQQVIVAGSVGAVEIVAARLSLEGIRTHRLASRRAFHTKLMTPSLPEIAAAAAGIELRPPRIPVVSNLTGRFFEAAHAPDANYFARQAESPVLFGAGVSILVQSGCTSFIEIGPGSALTGLIRTNVAEIAVSAMPDTAGDAIEQTLHAVARLWTAGADVDWEKVDVLAKGGPVSLPPYPFARTRCWVGASSVAVVETPQSPPTLPSHEIVDLYDAPASVAAIWAGCLGHERIDADDDYHRLGGDSLTAVRLAETISRRFGVAIRPIDFLGAATPRRLAALIEQRRSGGVSDESVVIRSVERGGDLLVLFHAIGGTVHLYGELLSHLPSYRSVRLVQALPLGRSGPQPDTMEVMAERYLALLDLADDRIVHFAGASFGGLVAIEAARQWRADGKDPASVILLDSPAPEGAGAPLLDEADAIAFVARLIGKPAAAETLRTLSADARRRFIIDMVSAHLPDGIEGQVVQVYLDVLLANSRAMASYRPPSFEAAPVTLIAASIRDWGQPACAEQGWRPLIGARMSVETVPGGHLSMLEEPHVRQTAAAIDRAMAQARLRPAVCAEMAS